MSVRLCERDDAWPDLPLGRWGVRYMGVDSVNMRHLALSSWDSRFDTPPL
eukprot:CAMPEP_0115838540 /NCGR_PEP_ID=MMETSP0287-20121206/5780_1 /TAXON_ID=412157 /ORGANISM="Chrysochromulina rotalis, Strain UIO044" /LENGTH=49 /DNA_ID=CAMNT_0003292067 /DNA_START=298 /DNA_END=447 /DNA_ORIENTATION=-